MPGPPLSFRASVHQYLEKWTTSAATAVGSTSTDISPAQNSVQSYGFLRQIALRMRNSVAASDGTGSGDFPFNIFGQISLTDPNGAEVYGGPTWGGYETYLAEKYGSYKLNNDPRLSTFYSASTTTPLLMLHIPLEFAESSGLGALPNFDAQSPYKLKVTTNPVATAYSTAPTTTNPTILLDYIIKCWTVPDAVNKQSGAAQTTFPPGIGQNIWGVQGVGCTVQHWTLSTPSVTASTAMTASLIRKGNIFRNVLLVGRGTSNVRQTYANAFPNPITFQIDGAPLWSNIDPAVILEEWFRRDGEQVASAGATSIPVAGPSDTGVLPVMFSNPDAVNIQGVDGTLGMQGFLGTNQASRVEFAGTWGANITVLQALTNDVNGVSLEGSSYAWSFAQQLQAPSQPSVRTGQ